MGAAETLIAAVAPSDATNKAVNWSSSDTSVATVDSDGNVTAVSTGVATITATTVDGGHTATCTVTVTQPGSGPEAVDLGLSVKWASYNVGATRPEDYGDYFAWGEVEPYYTMGHSQDNPCSSWRSRTNPAITGYNWESYKWCSGSSSTLIRYNTVASFGAVDNKTEFKDYNYSDDAAHSALGGSWRTPTLEEWEELRDNCSMTWTDNYNGSGVAGRFFTSKKDGYTDKSIFLPAAGARNWTDLNNAGVYGFYWTSSLYTNAPCESWRVYFGPGSVFAISSMLRKLGHPIRPVCDK